MGLLGAPLLSCYVASRTVGEHSDGKIRRRLGRDLGTGHKQRKNIVVNATGWVYIGYIAHFSGFGDMQLIG